MPVDERHRWVPAETFQYGTTTYELERNELDDGTPNRLNCAYRLTGPRGAQYGLIRNANRPEMLFAINMKLRSTPFEWFTDRDGVLVAVR